MMPHQKNFINFPFSGGGSGERSETGENISDRYRATYLLPTDLFHIISGILILVFFVVVRIIMAITIIENVTAFRIFSEIEVPLARP